MLLFYAQYTSEPYYRLIERNWGQTVTVEYQAHPEHNSYQLGDLSLDGTVNQADSEIYNSLQSPFGWQINNGKTHWYHDCSYIKDKPVRACLINNNLCLRCAARKVSE